MLILLSVLTGITATGYSGQFVVSEKVSSTEVKYQVQNAPTNALPTVTGSTLALSSDTVTSASPYIFNISLRSVFGMCGMEADGNKATGFPYLWLLLNLLELVYKKMIMHLLSIIKILHQLETMMIELVAGNETISNDSRARYKPSYRNFHVKVSNNSFIQAVSIFAIGFC